MQRNFTGKLVAAFFMLGILVFASCKGTQKYGCPNHLSISSVIGFK
jgi:hypothetical protein